VHLPQHVRQKVLIPAFARAMRDPFPPARSSGILALTATQEFYSPEDAAMKILPSLSMLTIDPDKLRETRLSNDSATYSLFFYIKGACVRTLLLE